MPMGVIIFCYEGIPAQRVPYLSEGELIEAFESAIENEFPQEKLFPYVRSDRPDVAEKLFAIMQKRLGMCYSVYQLTVPNLELVLGDNTVIL